MYLNFCGKRFTVQGIGYTYEKCVTQSVYFIKIRCRAIHVCYGSPSFLKYNVPNGVKFHTDNCIHLFYYKHRKKLSSNLVRLTATMYAMFTYQL